MSNPLELMLREQFGTPEQQRETSTAGMWIFLATEVLFFGGLFTTFAVYRSLYTHAFNEGSSEMGLMLGAINTAVLITSSLTMALSVHSASEGRNVRTYILLLATAFLGLCFLGIKFTEYYHHYQAHRVPGISFLSNSPEAGPLELFFVFYFMMTGLHALHMIIGIGVVSVFAARAALGSFNADYFTPVETVGLYWHFVDIVWVFLFAIFYIAGIHK